MLTVMRIIIFILCIWCMWKTAKAKANAELKEFYLGSLINAIKETLNAEDYRNVASCFAKKLEERLKEKEND